MALPIAAILATLGPVAVELVSEYLRSQYGVKTTEPDKLQEVLAKDDSKAIGALMHLASNPQVSGGVMSALTSAGVQEKIQAMIRQVVNRHAKAQVDDDVQEEEFQPEKGEIPDLLLLRARGERVKRFFGGWPLFLEIQWAILNMRETDIATYESLFGQGATNG